VVRPNTQVCPKKPDDNAGPGEHIDSPLHKVVHGSKQGLVKIAAEQLSVADRVEVVEMHAFRKLIDSLEAIPVKRFKKVALNW
jgi:hypothetical protein